MSLAAVIYESEFPIDKFLADVAASLRDDGVCLGGAIQTHTHDVTSSGSTMTLIDLASGHDFIISQDLGEEAKGCRLDPGSLAGAAAALEVSIREIDFLILNKFGRGEAEGGGLRNVFALALEAGVPILTAARPPYIDAWRQFHGGIATELTPVFDDVLSWCKRHLRAQRIV